MAAELFYARLFALDPSLKRLFRGDIAGTGSQARGVSPPYSSNP
jgi:hypothetical protein